MLNGYKGSIHFWILFIIYKSNWYIILIILDANYPCILDSAQKQELFFNKFWTCILQFSMLPNKSEKKLCVLHW